MRVKEMKSTSEIEAVWKHFQRQFGLHEEQLQKFKKYSSLLREWNKKINLTAITTPQKIIADHFQDSIMISKFIDFNTISMLADVGTGAGFPALPLKICFPHLSIVLIEVVQKKISFLEKVVEELGLANVVISSYDWRTFLRKTNYPVDLFCARASLSVEELLRVFSPNGVYHSAQLIYWASSSWSAPALAQPFISRQEQYTVDKKQRRYIFFKATSE